MLRGSLLAGGLWGRMNTCICMAEHSAMHLKLSQHCYSSVLQYKIKKFKNTNINTLRRQGVKRIEAPMSYKLT